MSVPIVPGEDPIVAALPPASDYITYLTLLEYNLGPHNLPTLTQLLSADDGTLAQEIGWDLLKLVLPLLQAVPEEASKCLQVVAKRGNPREVVVKISEELENIGDDEYQKHSDTGSGSDKEDDQDKLPSFAGEAERIHLGSMTLDGLPPVEGRQKKASDTTQEDVLSAQADSSSRDILRFSNLLSMLGILHPRIKTKYPSRFLATTLPAALDAYRRLPINEETTLSFLSLLQELYQKPKPTLPPRTFSATLSEAVTSPSTADLAKLPDPEATTRSQTTVEETISAGDPAIILKLYQAVLLEVLDEYIRSFEMDDVPTMSWMARTRETFEPKRLVPRKQTETQKWLTEKNCQDREGIARRFLTLSKHLQMDIDSLFGDTLTTGHRGAEGAEHDEAEAKVDEIQSEYPSSPSEISFSHSGLLFLFTASQFSSLSAWLSTLESLHDLPINKPDALAILKLVPHLTSNLSPQTSPAILDATLTLLYLSLRLPTPSPLPPITLQHLIITLSTISSGSLDPSLRDSAHSIASHLFYTHADPATKFSIITHILSHSTSAILHAAAITWLKDAFLSSTVPTDHQSAHLTPEPSVRTQNGIAIDPTALNSEPELTALLFPTPPFLFTPRHIPRYIATLNLVSILFSRSLPPHHPASTESVSDSATTTIPVEPRIRTYVQTLEDLRRGLQGDFENALIQSNDVRPVDLWAVDDALARAWTSLQTNACGAAGEPDNADRSTL